VTLQLHWVPAVRASGYLLWVLPKGVTAAAVQRLELPATADRFDPSLQRKASDPPPQGQHLPAIERDRHPIDRHLGLNGRWCLGGHPGVAEQRCAEREHHRGQNGGRDQTASHGSAMGFFIEQPPPPSGRKGAESGSQRACRLCRWF